MKHLLIFTILCFITACDSRPTFNNVINNFNENRISFNEIALKACELGLNKQPFSSKSDKYSYSPELIDNDYRDKEMDKLLKKIGGYVINYQKTTSNRCSLSIGYYAHGFAGSGMSYNYSFQLDKPKNYNKEKHTLEKITKRGIDTEFDMPLKDQWYFSFKYS